MTDERTDLAQQILEMLKKRYLAGDGAAMSPLSGNWWKNGFSQKSGYTRLLRMLTENAILFKDAVKAGTELVRAGLIRVGEKPPKYIQDLIDLAKEARLGNAHEFKKELQKVRKHVVKLRGQIMATPKGQYVELLTRAGKKKLLKTITDYAKGGSQKQFNADLEKYSYKQALYNARILQRSVVNDTFQARTRQWVDNNKEMVKFSVWQLAPARNFQDICDTYAGQKFKAGEEPDYPHYSCACTIQPILISADEYWSMRK